MLFQETVQKDAQQNVKFTTQQLKNEAKFQIYIKLMQVAEFALI